MRRCFISASKRDCDRCALKSRCCPKQASRRVPRSIYAGARGAPDSEIVGGRYLAPAPQENRDAVRAPQALSQARPFTFTRPKRRTRRVHPRSHRPEPSKDGQADPDARIDPAMRCSRRHYNELLPDFFNKIGPKQTSSDVRSSVLSRVNRTSPKRAQSRLTQRGHTKTNFGFRKTPQRPSWCMSCAAR